MSDCIDKHQKINKILSGDLQILKDLSANNVNITFNELITKKTGDSVLHTSAREGAPPDVQFLIDFFGPNCVNSKNKDDKTPLHEAAQFNRSENVEILIRHGANVNALKRADWTPLMMACTKTELNECERTVRLLLENGALVNYSNKDGWTALHLACREPDVRIVRLLLKYGADVSKVTKNKRTALHIACLHGNLETVEELLKLGVGCSLKDSCGNTPLHEAVLSGKTNICDTLVAAGALVSCVNNAGFGLLHFAASEGCVDMIEYLVNTLKCEVNDSTVCGFTPLHCACRKERTKAVEALIRLGGDVDLRDSFGRTCLDYLNL